MIPGDFLRMDHQALQRDLRLNVQVHLDLAPLWPTPGTARAWWAASRGIDDRVAGSPFRSRVCRHESLCAHPGRALHVEFQKVGVHVGVLSPGTTDTP
jgi:hypothetical protein